MVDQGWITRQMTEIASERQRAELEQFYRDLDSLRPSPGPDRLSKINWLFVAINSLYLLAGLMCFIFSGAIYQGLALMLGETAAYWIATLGVLLALGSYMVVTTVLGAAEQAAESLQYRQK